MIFLDKIEHEKWLNEKFPELADKLYGQPGEYISSKSGKLLGDFPIVNSIYNETNHPVFSTIIKLTNDERPTSYEATEEEKDFASNQQVNTQVVIIKVDKNLNLINKGHYPLSSTQIS